MKKARFLMVFLLSLFFLSCEEVVDVDLDTAAPKLVIEAAINWKKGTTGTQQTIQLSTTTGYFENVIPVVSGAVVSIKNSKNQQFNFTENSKTGRYVCNNFKPEINETYTLTVVSGGNTYTASETLKSVAPITRLEQNNEGGFTGKDIEVKAFFTDPPEDNFYLFKYTYSSKITSSYYVSEDKFYQGNEIFSSSDDDELKPGDEIEITHYGISKQYYNYMNILVSIAGSNVGGPFQSPPATVRGNIINTTDKTNYPLGYFSLSEIDSKQYKIE
ncbi:DUF4249 domain-containing protein [Flavobacterium reichenbachii]|uniref:DUF4249 domain-containing protein n=1 Tax=Flavobacterium reichenbachii TaxID=362418 RepID=A0A085ZP68_9FLAO|nr:DUF4249 domain-containing protein [Flavobacterium reichenbachii]KFF06232.1 hypothetical protein IW19_12125 [Flavobacterium reichenbachii]OXB17552.1 hypothetical protein B0A68_04455 [Flavobacterium reichenbachii]